MIFDNNLFLHQYISCKRIAIKLREIFSLAGKPHPKRTLRESFCNFVRHRFIKLARHAKSAHAFYRERVCCGLICAYVCSRTHAYSHASICVLIIIMGFNKSNVLTKTRKETKKKRKEKLLIY